MMFAQLHFPNSSSFCMELLHELHDYAMTAIVFVALYTGFILMVIVNPPFSSFTPLIHHNLETVWTMSPGLILISLVAPSLRALYILDTHSEPSITIKAVGHQWYWSYEYLNIPNSNFDSFMITDTNSHLDMNEMLEVDNTLVIPYSISSLILLTAADVIHSWALPSFGAKADALPGRLNSIIIKPENPGIFYGQCSEICGVGHSTMPIAIEVIDPSNWMNWIQSS